MVIEKEVMQHHLQNDEIMPYEDDLIEKLRNLYYEGLPLSIVLHSKYHCVTWCHHMAFQLSRGMDDFKLIRGNINVYQVREEPNHSWVEKDGFVYDTTDGFKWKKEIYYQYFGAVPIETYNKDNYMNFEFYQQELEKAVIKPDDIELLLNLELVELLETEDPSLNHHTLLEEITIFRENKNLTNRLPQEFVEGYKKMMFELMTEIEETNNEENKMKKSVEK